MKIGTDLSISECRTSGYSVIDFNKRDLVKAGKLDKDHYVRLSVSFPERWNDAGRPDIKAAREGLALYSTDVDICWNDIHEQYIRHKEGIDSFADLANCPIEMDNPTAYNLLNLADIVNSYCGIE